MPQQQQKLTENPAKTGTTHSSVVVDSFALSLSLSLLPSHSLSLALALRLSCQFLNRTRLLLSLRRGLRLLHNDGRGLVLRRGGRRRRSALRGGKADGSQGQEHSHDGEHDAGDAEVAVAVVLVVHVHGRRLRGGDSRGHGRRHRGRHKRVDLREVLDRAAVQLLQRAVVSKALVLVLRGERGLEGKLTREVHGVAQLLQLHLADVVHLSLDVPLHRLRARRRRQRARVRVVRLVAEEAGEVELLVRVRQRDVVVLRVLVVVVRERAQRRLRQRLLHPPEQGVLRLHLAEQHADHSQAVVREVDGRRRLVGVRRRLVHEVQLHVVQAATDAVLRRRMEVDAQEVVDLVALVGVHETVARLVLRHNVDRVAVVRHVQARRRVVVRLQRLQVGVAVRHARDVHRRLALQAALGVLLVLDEVPVRRSARVELGVQPRLRVLRRRRRDGERRGGARRKEELLHHGGWLGMTNEVQIL
eukprot:Rhum_TRINITY_DN14320_c0_g1::Rhum_TRINITY_DN14320_c0_g1_i2::g.80134::m.80134